MVIVVKKLLAREKLSKLSQKSMATNTKHDHQIVLLETKDAPESGWEEYLRSNPTMIFHGMKILEITRLDLDGTEFFNSDTKVCY